MMASQSGVGGQPEAVSQRGVAAGDWARGSVRWCADDRAADVQRRLQQVLQGVKDLVLLKGEQWVRGHLDGTIGASQGEGGLAGLKDTGYWVRKEPPQDEVCNRRWETAVEPNSGL